MNHHTRTSKELLKAILRQDFYSFIHKSFCTVNPGAAFLPNWHIELIAQYLEAARRGDMTRLIINMPPRALKSHCVSVAWPAWLLGQNPSTRIMAASYAMPLALKHSLDCRAVVQSPWYKFAFPATQLSRVQNEKTKFLTSQHGFRFATSVGGVATGEGGDFLIVDDPINPLQAEGKVWREHVNQWFDQTFLTRLNDKRRGVIVLVMQRLHQQDLSGYLLEKGGWEHLCLPAITTEPQTYSFGLWQKTMEEGEALHPARDSADTLQRLQHDMGSHAFAAQYLQQPVPEEGYIIKPQWLRRYQQLPLEPTRIVQSWDTAIKAGSHHDASACVTIMESSEGAHIASVEVMRMEYPELKRAVLRLAERDKPHVILIEDKASGQQLIQDIRRTELLPLVPCLPKGDKTTRFCAASALIEAGKVLLPVSARWLATFEEELLTFPQGKHDDQVDAITQYLNWIREHRPTRLQVRPL